MDRSLLDWLLEGDPSIRYQVHADLLEEDRPDLQKQISREGWGAAFLELRRTGGSTAG